MIETEETKKCPYCSEQILRTAKKCKHCGEWLEVTDERKGSDWTERGSVDARAVTRGIKQKEQDDFNQGCLIFFILVGSIIAGVWISNTFNSGTAGWIVGIIIFLVAGVWSAKGYFKE